MGEGKPRLVLDTNVLISALGWNGPERRLLRACLTGDIQLCISMPLLDESIRVLAYPKLGFPAEDQRTMVEDLLRIADLATDPPQVDAVKADPDDNHVLACALAAGADLIVTGDAHLLALGTFAGIPIVPAAAVGRFTDAPGPLMEAPGPGTPAGPAPSGGR